MTVSTELVRQLMEVGYVAAGCGLSAEADRIFQGVKAVRPDSEAPVVGRAVAWMNAGKAPEAIGMLQAELQRLPESDVLMAFLGLAMQMAGLGQASETVLKQVVESGRDPSATAMADAILHPADE